MTKNVTVFDSEGKIIGKTYAKRAAGLVKNGRARYLGGDEPAIILARSPYITSEEDETMSTFNSDELRAKIDEMLHEAREKLEDVCRSAADAIDDLADKIEDTEDASVETDGEVTDEELGESECACEGEECDAEGGESADAPNGTPERGRFIRISEEDMEKLKARLRSVRAMLGNLTDEAKAVAVRTGAEIGKYTESLKAKVSEKLAEREAEAEAKAKSEKAGSEEYYLRKIEEIQRDTSHLVSMENSVKEFVRNAASEDEGMSDAVTTIAGIAREHEYTNRKLLDFYFSRLEALRRSDD